MTKSADEIHKQLEDVNETIRAKVKARAKARQLLDRLAKRLPSLRKRRKKLRKALEEAQASGRVKPNVVVERNVVNQSSRSGVRPRLIVLHSTESTEVKGSGDLAAIAAYFDNPAAQASSHVITDGDGNSARCVPDAAKAWTCVSFNSLSLNIEQIGRAASTVWSEEIQRETARWIAKWSKDWGIPIVRGAVSGTSVTRSGVVFHSELGAAGGGHSDPGANYPIGKVLDLAEAYRKQL